MQIGADATIAVVGPTAAGKSALALDFAERCGAEIVNLDSRQVYHGLDIGSAKPGAAERRRVPHHLFDVAAPDEPFDCARYRQLAIEAIEVIHRRGRTALLVGGTGLYLRVLRDGLFPGPPRQAALRARLAEQERRQPGSLHAQLAAVDPEAAARLHPRDRSRVIRALEVYETTGRTLSDWHRQHRQSAATPLPLTVIGVTLDRAHLYERIDRRCRTMIDAGLIDEVRALTAAGYGPDLAAMRSIGYREIGAYLRGETTLDAAVDAMAKATRRLAKRQLTWFRHVAGIRWHDPASGCL